MQTGVGNDGWICVSDTDRPLTYARFAREGSRWVLREVYLAVDTGELRSDDLRSVPAAELAAIANSPDVSEHLASRAGIPGPDLRRLASHFATTWGSQATHWVAQSWRAQYPKSGVKQAPMGKPPRPQPAPAAVPSLRTPPEGLTDAFLLEVAHAYAVAVALGMSPATAIADTSGVSARTVHKWVYTARKRGLMAPGRQGRIG